MSGITAVLELFTAQQCMIGTGLRTHISSLWEAFAKWMHKRANDPTATALINHERIDRQHFVEFFSARFGSKENKVVVDGVRARGWPGIALTSPICYDSIGEISTADEDEAVRQIIRVALMSADPQTEVTPETLPRSRPWSREENVWLITLVNSIPRASRPAARHAGQTDNPDITSPEVIQDCQCSANQYIQWSVIANLMPGNRSGQCVRDHYLHVLKPDRELVRKKWEPWEEELLIRSVYSLATAYGIAQTPDNSESTFPSFINKNINSWPWEDIAQSIPCRDGQQCQNRWKQLIQSIPPLNGEAVEGSLKRPIDENLSPEHTKRPRGRPKKTKDASLGNQSIDESALLAIVQNHDFQPLHMTMSTHDLDLATAFEGLIDCDNCGIVGYEI